MSRFHRRARSLSVGKFLGMEQLECRTVLNGGSFCDAPLPQQHTEWRPEPVAIAPAQVQTAQGDCRSDYAAPSEPARTAVTIVDQQFAPVDHVAPPTYTEVLIVRYDPPPRTVSIVPVVGLPRVGRDVYDSKVVDLDVGPHPQRSPVADPVGLPDGAAVAAAAEAIQQNSTSGGSTQAVVNAAAIQAPPERAAVHVAMVSALPARVLAAQNATTGAMAVPLADREAAPGAAVTQAQAIAESTNTCVASRTRAEQVDQGESSPLSPAAAVAELTHGKAVLADISLNLPDVERALENAMHQVERLGGQFSDWLDEHQLTAVAAGVAAATAGGAALWYWRRNVRQKVELRDDETSSNWLFVRLQTTPGEI